MCEREKKRETENTDDPILLFKIQLLLKLLHLAIRKSLRDHCVCDNTKMNMAQTRPGKIHGLLGREKNS